jgi:HAD superfamily hydrolase (TIGR01509 family)
MIEELKKSHKIAVCTNAPKDFFYTVFTRGKIEYLFDVVIVSSEVGYIKPDPKIFELTLSALGVSKEEAVFFDDSKDNVVGAQMFGLESVLFTTPEQVRPYID